MELKLDISDDAQIHTVDFCRNRRTNIGSCSQISLKKLYDDGLMIKGAKHGDLMRKLLN